MPSCHTAIAAGNEAVCQILNLDEPDVGDGRVVAALARLSEGDREALTLVAWDGLTPAHAAAVLGEPAARFRQRLHRAGRRLRAQLAAERGPEEPVPAHPHDTSSGVPA